MRISADKNDVDYSPHSHLYKVKLNGEFLQHCITADDQLHIALVYKKDAEGKFIVHFGEVERDVLHGQVEIIKP